jgi:hypothetical protein
MGHYKKSYEWVEIAHGEFHKVPIWLLDDYGEVTVEKEEPQKNNPYYRQFEKKKKGKQ